jgi:nitrite reductase/ring-hydroxylating ferredoxin subunit
MSRWVKFTTLDRLPPGSALEVDYDGRIYALFHAQDGKISVIDGICAHQGGPLAEGKLDGPVVTCPWHGWQFDMRTGRSLIHKSVCVAIFEVKVEGDDVYVLVP